MTVPIIAVDGPSGSGKGTVSRRLAERLGWHLLDSGALYRLVALAGAARGLADHDETGHAAIAATLDVRFEVDAAGGERVLLDGRDVTRDLRAAGHDVEVIEPFSDFVGHAGALVRDGAGVISGAADPRSDGTVAGW